MKFRHIRELREDNDIPQKQIAEYLGVAQNTYSQYETGIIEWTAPILIKLSEFYNVSVDYLLDLTDNKERNYGDSAKKLSPASRRKVT